MKFLKGEILDNFTLFVGNFNPFEEDNKKMDTIGFSKIFKILV
jgi:hypothetical protein